MKNKIINNYSQRSNDFAFYHAFKPHISLSRFERNELLHKFLTSKFANDFSNVSVFDIGFGYGDLIHYEK